METLGHHDLCQGISSNTAFRQDAHEAVRRRRRTPDAMDVRTADAPVVPTAVPVSAAARNTAVRQLKDGRGIHREFEFQGDTLHISSKNTYIAAGIDDSLRDTAFAEAFDSAINGIAFGDAPEIDPKGKMKFNPAIRPKLDVPPGATQAPV